jgi:hypothetical protein
LGAGEERMSLYLEVRSLDVASKEVARLERRVEELTEMLKEAQLSLKSANKMLTFYINAVGKEKKKEDFVKTLRWGEHGDGGIYIEDLPVASNSDPDTEGD